MNLVLSQILPLSLKFHKKFKDSEPIFDAIYASLNADMSGTGKDVKNTVNCSLCTSSYFFYVKNRNFSFNSFPLKIMLDPPPLRSPSLRGDPQVSVDFIKCVGPIE